MGVMAGYSSFKMKSRGKTYGRNGVIRTKVDNTFKKDAKEAGYWRFLISVIIWVIPREVWKRLGCASTFTNDFHLARSGAGSSCF